MIKADVMALLVALLSLSILITNQAIEWLKSKETCPHDKAVTSNYATIGGFWYHAISFPKCTKSMVTNIAVQSLNIFRTYRFICAKGWGHNGLHKTVGQLDTPPVHGVQRSDDCKAEHKEDSMLGLVMKPFDRSTTKTIIFVHGTTSKYKSSHPFQATTSSLPTTVEILTQIWKECLNTARVLSTAHMKEGRSTICCCCALETARKDKQCQPYLI